MNKKLWTVLVHILAWALFLCLPLLFMPSPPPGKQGPMPEPGMLMRILFLFLIPGALFAGFYFLNYFILIPRLYFRKRKLLYPLACAACLALTLFFVWILQAAGNHGAHHHRFFSPVTMMISLMFILVFFISFGIRITAQWKEIEQRQVRSELDYLKAQINPHFLFNTLNSLYVLAHKKSDYTADGIMQLSDMMRYVITEAHNEMIPVQAELDYIRNYVVLQKLRVPPTTRVELEIEAAPAGQKIAPMLLMPFIENAFKHGISTESEGTIHIHVVLTENALELAVKNPVVRQAAPVETPTHLGIANTKKRLELLYPGQHHLRLHRSDTEFNVKLILSLA